MADRTKLALIDAHALIHRAYHALPPMTTAKGVPTNAVYGFTTMLLKMLTTLKPTHVAAAFDVKGPTFREEKFADYKKHRKPAPDDLIVQFDVVKEVLEAFNIPVISLVGYEADDVIGTIVKQLKNGIRTVIVTGDMDTLQLVSGTTSIFTMKRGITDTVLYDEEAVREKFGFGPELVADYKGLRGDPSDNIPGVKGVGDKTARELVQRYGTIEDIYTHLDDLPKRIQTKLAGQQEAAVFSRSLATIHADIPIVFNLKAAEFEGFDRMAVEKIFLELGFKSLLTRIPKGSRPVPEIVPSEIDWPENYFLVESDEERGALKKLLRSQKLMALDTENEYLGARRYPIIGMSFAFKEGKKIRAYYVPVTRETVKEWRDILEDPKIGKVGHNLKYDMEVLRQSDIHVRGVVFDTMVASYLLQAGARQHNLDTLAVQELGYRATPITDLIGTGKNQKHLNEVPLKQLARYAAEDAEVTLRLYEVFAPKIKDAGLTRVMQELELPLLEVLVDMELNGIAVDGRVLKELKKKVARRLQALTEKIWQAAGGQFNINSTQQLRKVLFEGLNLPTVGVARTQTGYSTAAAELVKLKPHHPIIGFIEEYRELAKLLNTYIETLPVLVDAETGRIYASFNQAVAATGRLSSSDPNLQNIPVRTDIGQEIRRAFVAPEGRRLVKADYSQIELRLAAHLSRDEKMLETFRAGGDIHTATAAWVYGIPENQVTQKQRREAKTLNFGVLYGMGSASFAQAAGISAEEARSFIGRYREQYTGLMQYIEAVLETARTQGYVETLFGRRRYVPEIQARAPAVRSQAERAAFNFPLQGTAADILKKAMVELHRMMQEKFPQAKLVLTVHDELVAEVPEEAVTEFAGEMRRVMEGVFTLDVPMVVEVAAGKNWKEMGPV